jgi:hypothetical protein
MDHLACARTRCDELASQGGGTHGGADSRTLTYDGKRLQGPSADEGGIHPPANGFEARVPSGAASWPESGGGVR